MRVYFFTNCQMNKTGETNDGAHPAEFENRIANDGVQSFRVGFADVSVDADERHVLDTVQLYDQDLTAENPILGSTKLLEELRGAMKDEGKDTLFFVHGYNNSPREVLGGLAFLKTKMESYMAELKEINGKDVVPADLIMVGFIWPSRDKLFGYLDDRAMAAASGPALARGLLKYKDFLQQLPNREACNQKVHMVTHSMGAYVLRNAIQNITGYVAGALPQVFNQVALTAPDEDSDAFDTNEKLRRLPELCRRTTLYMNRGDLALVASDRVKFNPARLGQMGPSSPHTLPNNVVIVDATKVAGDIRDEQPLESGGQRLLGHGYPFYISDVTRDIAYALAGVAQDDDSTHRVWVPGQNKYEIRVPPESVPARTEP